MQAVIACVTILIRCMCGMAGRDEDEEEDEEATFMPGPKNGISSLSLRT